MKRSFYLFNPGIIERKDNTLKFTPITINEDKEEVKLQPRFIPIEDVAELYAFGSLRANSALYNFFGTKRDSSTFLRLLRELHGEFYAS